MGEPKAEAASAPQNRIAELRLSKSRRVRTLHLVYSSRTWQVGGEYTMLKQFFQEEDGQTLVEYGLLISFIALVALTAIAAFGGKVANMWGDNAERFPSPTPVP